MGWACPPLEEQPCVVGPAKLLRGYRAMFDLRPNDASLEPIDLRLYLRLDGQPLSETWIYNGRRRRWRSENINPPDSRPE